MPARRASSEREAAEAPQSGEGGCWPYQTKAGERFRAAGPVLIPDGTVKTARQRGFLTKKAGQDWLSDQQSAGRKGEYIEPSKAKLGAYGTDVIDGLRVGAQTKSSYQRFWRLHVEAYPIAALPLAQVTGTRLTSHYRVLEKTGRRDHRKGEGLSARSVRYVHTIISRVLRQAVRDGLLPRNAAAAATPPTAREAKPPEMTCWAAPQLAAFLAWSADHSQYHALFHVMAYTGMRRGEGLEVRWRDFDAEAGTLSVRRSAGVIHEVGEAAEIVVGDTKSGRPRVIDLDPATVALLRSWRRERGSLALQLARDDALIFGDIEGDHRNPEYVTRRFGRAIGRCRRALGDDAIPVIRLHDLRHTHATLLLLAREPVHVVSQRLGHASPVITMSVYAHVLPGNQREAASTFARLIAEAAGQ